jgi:hypothetical protein
MKRALAVTCLLLAVSTLWPEVVPSNELDGTFWVDLSKDQKSHVLTGYLVGLYTLWRVFENEAGPHARIGKILPWQIPPSELTYQIDTFYSDRTNRRIPLWMAVLTLEGVPYERLVPQKEIPPNSQEPSVGGASSRDI